MATNQCVLENALGKQSFDDNDNENIPTDSGNVLLKHRFSAKGDEIIPRRLECISPLGVLIDNSRQWANENQQNFTPTSKGGTRIQPVAMRKKEVPLLERLRVIKASGCSGSATPKKPLPEEVIVDNDDDVLGGATVVSGLGVDGLASVCTTEKRRPMAFTFDGVVPSRSSLDEFDAPPELIYPIKPSDSVQQGLDASKILDELEYEQDDELEPLQLDEPICAGLESFVKARERLASTGTTSSELSIELSESQHLRNCEFDEKYMIFSPTAKSGPKEEESRIDHGFDVIINSCSVAEKEKATDEKEISSAWINLNFLGIW